MDGSFMLGNEVDLSQALVVTLFSMGIVFLTLLAISFILDGFRGMFFKTIKQPTQIKKKGIVVSDGTNEQPSEEQDELIAVITAAISATLSESDRHFVVTSIKRISGDMSNWTMSGIQEQYNNKF